MLNEIKDRYRGCIIAGAVGDALGYPVEFSSLSDIKKYYGEHGITKYKYFDGFDKAIITDDTQMTLFTANGLLCCAAKLQTGEYVNEQSYIYQAYLDWLYTQNNPVAMHPFIRNQTVNEMPENTSSFQSWLMSVEWLYGRRAPGNTCISALQSKKTGNISNPINNSKGCGGVMRTAPAGLYAKTPEEALKIGAEAAAITHGHPLGYIPAGVLGYIVYCAVHTNDSLERIILNSIDSAKNFFSQFSDAKSYIAAFENIMMKAILYASSDAISDSEAISEIGEGWVGEEALAIAVYCALRYPDNFEKSIILSVNHDGDSDSTGAITGNIIGSRLGLKKIPEKFTDTLEGMAELIIIADDMYCMENHDDIWKQRYLK